MDSKVAGSWIAAGANFAVLAGLVLVAVQIRQRHGEYSSRRLSDVGGSGN